jgi:hypothetical protein
LLRLSVKAAVFASRRRRRDAFVASFDRQQITASGRIDWKRYFLIVCVSTGAIFK